MKILRDQPNTLQGAVRVATNEQNLRTRVQMSHLATILQWKLAIHEVNVSDIDKDTIGSTAQATHRGHDRSNVGTVVD